MSVCVGVCGWVGELVRGWVGLWARACVCSHVCVSASLCVCNYIHT